jgi:hypothetical protein
MDELVMALQLTVSRREDWNVAGSDRAMTAGLLDERLEKIEGLLRTAVDKLSEELNR